jgi:hypothetical protein
MKRRPDLRSNRIRENIAFPIQRDSLREALNLSHASSQNHNIRIDDIDDVRESTSQAIDVPGQRGGRLRLDRNGMPDDLLRAFSVSGDLKVIRFEARAGEPGLNASGFAAVAGATG